MIIFLQQRPIEILPPVISLLRILKDAGEKVSFLGLMKTDASETILKGIGIEYEFYPYKIVTFHERPAYRIWQKATQWYRPYLFRRWVWNRINGLKKQRQNIILWSSEMVSAAVLGDKALDFGKRHIQSLYELGDEAGKNYLGFNIEKMYRVATLIECEYNRAHIIKAEKGIPMLPFVLPNKPYAHPRTKNIPVSDAIAAKIVDGWANKRVFLYQGAIQTDRGELVNLLECLCVSRPNSVVAVLGKKNAIIDRLSDKYKNFSFVPFVQPPYHLEITSRADVGIAYYQGGAIWGLSPLNSVYCAPNKIYEYAGFGIPIICNDIPGLRYSIGQSHAGVCLPEVSRSSVKNALDTIFNNYDYYSSNAKSFFEATDIIGEVTKILSYVRSE